MKRPIFRETRNIIMLVYDDVVILEGEVDRRALRHVNRETCVIMKQIKMVQCPLPRPVETLILRHMDVMPWVYQQCQKLAEQVVLDHSHVVEDPDTIANELGVWWNILEPPCGYRRLPSNRREEHTWVKWYGLAKAYCYYHRWDVMDAYHIIAKQGYDVTLRRGEAVCPCKNLIVLESRDYRRLSQGHRITVTVPDDTPLRFRDHELCIVAQHHTPQQHVFWATWRKTHGKIQLDTYVCVPLHAFGV